MVVAGFAAIKVGGLIVDLLKLREVNKTLAVERISGVVPFALTTYNLDQHELRIHAALEEA